MALRKWQAECIDKALCHYQENRHFFCQATPGAGKTRFAAELANHLLSRDLIDAVICFAPGRSIIEGMKQTFEKVLQRPFNGHIGSIGMAMTYQSIEHCEESFWQLFANLRVLAVFDEIHHCSAGSPEMAANQWGQKIVQRLQDSARYTLALSGTPWRSDQQPIVLARYSTPEGRLILDFQYSLEEAIKEGICRSPRITIMDNTCIQLIRQGQIRNSYQGFLDLLRRSNVSYEGLVTNNDIDAAMLKEANKKLDHLRHAIPDAAGLVIASSIQHARQIAYILNDMGESSIVVSTQHSDSHCAIESFKISQDRWIVAVGMISEGTDIPRLQVCCYLSRVRTELYFRQVLGRILRRRSTHDDMAWLYIIYEQQLSKFANRVSEDLPRDLAVVSNLGFDQLAINNEESGYFHQEHLPATENSESLHPLNTGCTTEDSILKPLNFVEVSLAGEYRKLLLSIL